MKGQPHCAFVGLWARVGSHILCYRVVQSPFGSIRSAISDREERVEFFLHFRPYKIRVYAISAGPAGLTEAHLSSVFTYVDHRVLGVTVSTEFLLWVIFEGNGSFLSAMLGAVLLRF